MKGAEVGIDQGRGSSLPASDAMITFRRQCRVCKSPFAVVAIALRPCPTCKGRGSMLFGKKGTRVRCSNCDGEMIAPVLCPFCGEKSKGALSEFAQPIQA